MTDNTQKAQGSGAGEADDGPCTDCWGTGVTTQTERRCACQPILVKAENELGSPANDDLARLIETRLLGIPADEQDLELDDHDWRRIIAAISQPPEASGPKPWYETDAHRDLSRIIPDMEGKIAEAKIRFGHCLPANLFAPIEASITELRVLRHELAAIPAPEASEVEAVAYASPEQMAAMGDPIGDMAGAYIPLRKTPAGKFTMPLYAHPPKASPMQEGEAMGQEFDAGVEVSAALTGEMLKAALLEEGGDAYMRNEDTPSHFLIDGIVDLDAVARSLAQPAPEQGEGN